MSNNSLGNNLLYLLSEKKSLKWGQFKQYVEYLYRQDKFVNRGVRKYEISPLSDNLKLKSEDFFQKYWPLARNLSAMAYLDIEGKTGERDFKVAPPVLVELPFLKLNFILTGARSPKLLETIKESSKKYQGINIEIKNHNLFPDTVIIKLEIKSILKKWLEETTFQGDKLSEYIKVSENPPAWDILDFAGSLTAYKESLKDNWFGGNETDVKENFDIKSLKFKPFDSNKDSIESDLSLIKVFHQENFYKYYLFSKQNKKKVEVDLDWGKFLVLTEQSQKTILEYNKKTFELSSSLRLPLIFERGLTLLSGDFQEIQKKKSAKKEKWHKKPFVFKSVPYEIAKVVSEKLEQNLKEI